MSDGRPAGPLGFGYVIPAALGIILGAVYMLWMCQRVLFGPLSEPAHTPDTSRGLARDLTRREIFILAPIAAACLFLGVYPKPMVDSLEVATRQHILREPYTFAIPTEQDEAAIAPSLPAVGGMNTGVDSVVLGHDLDTAEVRP